MKNSRIENLPHALKPAGPHARVPLTATASTLAELGYTPPSAVTSDYFDIQITDGAARVTVDGETDPVASSTGFVWLNNTNYRMSRFMLVRLKLVIEGEAPVLQIQPVGV